jgi:hypothetical protein
MFHAAKNPFKQYSIAHLSSQHRFPRQNLAAIEGFESMYSFVFVGLVGEREGQLLL